MPSIVDGILSGNALTTRLLGNAKKWSGESLKRPIMFQKNSSGGSYSGFDTFSVAQVNTRVSLSFDPRQEYQSVVLSNLDLAVNATQERVLDLLKVEMETAKLSMMDNIGTRFYGDGTGNTNKDFLGLLAHVDDGDVVATYGTLARATYPTALNALVTDSVGQITKSRMATSFNSAKVGSDKPSLIVTEDTTWTYIEALLDPQVRAAYTANGMPQVTRMGMAAGPQALHGHLGFDAILFRGVPVVADEKCTSGSVFFLNEKYLQWFGLDHPSHKNIELAFDTIESGSYNDQEVPKKKFGFSWSGLKEPTNQDAEIGQILLYGNLVCWSPRHQAALKGVTS